MKTLANINSVLIIDDDPVIVETLSAFCRHQGINHVKIASDGDVAINILKTNCCEVDLIFCDINMPRTNGVEVLTYLSKIGCQTPFILVSSANPVVVNSVETLADAGYTLNLVGTIYKPIEFNLIKQILLSMNESKNHRPRNDKLQSISENLLPAR